MALDKKKSTIEYLRMEPADNGVIISWTERTPSNSKGTFENSMYKDHKEVYDIDEDNEEDDIEKAFSKFKELWMRSYNEMKG